MIHYYISKVSTQPQTLHIKMTLDIGKEGKILLQLPAWRPGRYELTDYAANITNVSGIDCIPEKETRNTWKLTELNNNTVAIEYDYYAARMDAGNSWVDDEQVYINFINLLLYRPDFEDQACIVHLDLPTDYNIQCSLGNSGGEITAPNFQTLVDSPVFASNSLKTTSYMVGDTTFEFVIHGDYQPSEQVINDFVAFTEVQTAMFGGFPANNFKFMIQALPYRHYHGVEHKNSTVITIGPATELNDRKLYKELLGVSSHELFHCWNVTRIRPAELLPYDFSKECYYQTGFITEGITTYYGDLMLIRANAFSEEEYLFEISRSLQRHLENPGRHKSSLTESSIDLWLDGYKNQPPYRGVSIYTKGMLTALILDLKIMIESTGTMSLDNVMQDMWEEFGDQSRGYTISDYKRILYKYLEGPTIEEYLSKYIFGKEPIENELNDLLSMVGFEISAASNTVPNERDFGFRISEHGKHRRIIKVEPDSPSFGTLMPGDIVNNIEITSSKCVIEYSRNGIDQTKTLTATTKDHLKQFRIKPLTETSPGQEKLKNYWLYRK